MNKQEIRAQLEGVDPLLCVAFAARAAMRVLPLLARKEKSAFGYWKKNRAKHLLSIVLAQRLGVYCSVGGKMNSKLSIIASDAADAADAAYPDDAYPDAIYAAAAASAAAYAYAYAAYPDAAYVAAYPDASAAAAAASAAAAAYAASAAYAYDVKPYMVDAITADLTSIKAVQSPPKLFRVFQKDHFCLSFMQSPLWPDGSPPQTIQTRWHIFRANAISLEAGFDVWLDWYEDRFAGRPLDLTLLDKQVNIPQEIEAQGVHAVNAYLATLNQSTLQQLNLVRGIFIGNGGAGKTSLIRALHGEKIVPGKEKMTPGVVIREWPVGGTNITARFWDFGGQVMSHATHQFFLRERCLYILVLDARTEINANDQAEYWLEHVKAFGKSAPVMLVGNKSELTPVNLDLQALREKYSNIVDFYPISCVEQGGSYQSRFETFRTDLITQLQQVGTHQLYFSKQQFSVLKAVRERSQDKAFLSHKKFDKLCDEHQIGDIGLSREDFLDLLDKLGEVIHFPQLQRLTSYILNPHWLTYGVYTLLYSAEIRQAPCGELSEDEAIRILQKQTVKDDKGHVLDYPNDKCGFILEAMEEFQLCYRLPGKPKRFVIPDKLPTDQPAFPFDKNQAGTLAFTFEFRGFLPRHVMPNLIVARHDEIQNGIVWQNGAILYNNMQDTTARVQVDYHERVLNIWVQGMDVKETLVILTDAVRKILKRMADLEYREMVMLPEHARLSTTPFKQVEKAAYPRLLASARAGDREFLSESGTRYDLNRILGTIMTEQKLTQLRQEYHMGDHYHFSGDFRGANMAIKSTLERVTQTVGQIPDVNADDKATLEGLIVKLNDTLQQLPKDQAQQADAVAQIASQLVETAKQPTPNKTLLDISGKGLVEAAKAIGKIAPTVLDVVTKIVSTIGKIAG